MGDWLYRMYLLAVCGAALGILLWVDSASPPLGDQSPDCIVVAGKIEFCGKDAVDMCETIEPTLIELREMEELGIADWTGAKACARLMR